MKRKSTQLRGALLVLLLLFGVQIAVPHIHTAASHDPQICTGHLANHDSPDESHTRACPVCRTSRQSRDLALQATGEITASSDLTLVPAPDVPERRPLIAELASDAPRAPPLS